MKNSEPNGFHLQSQAVCYGGRDGFTNLASAKIRLKSLFSAAKIFYDLRLDLRFVW